MITVVTQVNAMTSRVFHTFEFGTYGDNENIDVLDYKYARSDFTIARAPDWQLSSQSVQQHDLVSGYFPVGEYFYMKWRVKSDGKIYEKTVDLRNLLPADMDEKRIHPKIIDDQLYIYLISKEGIRQGAPKCPIKLYPDNKCVELYPKHWANF